MLQERKIIISRKFLYFFFILYVKCNKLLKFLHSKYNIYITIHINLNINNINLIFIILYSLKKDNNRKFNFLYLMIIFSCCSISLKCRSCSFWHVYVHVVYILFPLVTSILFPYLLWTGIEARESGDGSLKNNAVFIKI